jgi:hypothetical protein
MALRPIPKKRPGNIEPTVTDAEAKYPRFAPFSAPTAEPVTVRSLRPNPQLGFPDVFVLTWNAPDNKLCSVAAASLVTVAAQRLGDLPLQPKYVPQ